MMASKELPVVLLLAVITACQSRPPDYQRDKPWCALGWNYYWPELTCVKAYASPRNKTEATTFCENKEAQLVNVETPEKLEFVKSSLNQDIGYWIKKTTPDPKWSPLDVLTGDSSNSCVRVALVPDGLRQENCNLASRYSFICEKNVSVLASAMCPSDWNYFQGESKTVCLKTFFAYQNDLDSEIICKDEAGILAMPTSEEIYKVMRDMSLGVARNQKFWVGIRSKDDKDPDSWLEYFDGQDIAGCPMITSRSTVKTSGCRTRLGSVCEKPMAFRPLWCPPQRFLYYDESMCVWPVFEPQTQSGANQVCKANGGNLVNIANRRKLEFVKHPSLNTSMSNFLVGSWFKGEDSEYENWTPMEVLSGNKSLPCVAYTGRAHLLRWVDCENTFGYICETKPNPLCPPGWRYSFEPPVCYAVFSDVRVVYNEAASRCINEFKGTLFLSNNQSKFQLLLELESVNDPAGTSIWVGMYQSGGFEYYADGTEVPLCNWIRPDYHGFSGYQNCSTQQPFICERPVARHQDSVTCPDRWLFYWEGLMCVRYFLTRTTMEGARGFCDRERAKVISLTSSRKEQFMMSSRSTPQMEYWIEDIPRSMHQSLWSPAQLLRGELDIDNFCVTISSVDFLFNKTDCYATHFYICEYPSDSSVCLATSKEIEGVCIEPYFKSLNFDAANDECTTRRGRLVIPTSEDKYNAMKNRFNVQPMNETFWIGMRSNGVLKYVNGTDIHQPAWLRDVAWSPVRFFHREPVNMDNTFCVTMGSSDFFFTKADCNTLHSYICEIPRDSYNNRTCPNPSSSVGDVCIQLNIASVKFDVANDLCGYRPGRLMMPTSEDKYNTIKNIFHESPINRTFWIGMRAASGVLKYLNGTEIPSCWGMKPYEDGIIGYQSCVQKKLVACETQMVVHRARSCVDESWLAYYHDGTCIKFFDYPETLKKAKETCERNKAWLVNITDTRKAEFVDFQRRSRDHEYWIGQHYPESLYTKEWSLINIYNYTGDRSQNCVSLVGREIQRISCHRTIAVVCEKEVAVRCPNGWLSDNGRPRLCIKAFKEQLTFFHAVDFCQRIHGGNIATPTNQLILSIITQFTADNAPRWIGITILITDPRVLTYLNDTRIPSARTIKSYSPRLSGYQDTHLRKYFSCERVEDHTGSKQIP